MTYKLTYFNARGRAEPIRFLLAQGLEDYEDIRISKAKWPEIKATMPFRRVPVIEIDGKVINQSVAIERYLAKKYKLVGRDDMENLQIDAVVDTMVDLHNQVADFNFATNKEVKDEKRQNLLKEAIPTYFSKFDEIVKNNGGFFIGGRLSWADLHFAAVSDTFESILDRNLLEGYQNLTLLRRKIFELPPIRAWMAKRPKTDF